MQRLEVSGAVRPIYRSLGVKRLMYELKKKMENLLGPGRGLKKVEKRCSRRQKSDMKQVEHQETTNMRSHFTKFSRPGARKMYTPDSCIPSTVQFITELLQKYTCTKNLTQGSCTIMQTRRKEKYMILYNPITQSTNPYKIQKAVSAKGCDEQNTPFLHCTFFFLPFQALIRFLLHDWRTLLSLAAGSLFFFFPPPLRLQSLFLHNFLPALFIYAFNLRVVLCRRHPNHTKQNFPPSSFIRCGLHNKQHEVHINVTVRAGGGEGGLV